MPSTCPDCGQYTVLFHECRPAEKRPVASLVPAQGSASVIVAEAYHRQRSELATLRDMADDALNSFRIQGKNVPEEVKALLSALSPNVPGQPRSP